MRHVCTLTGLSLLCLWTASPHTNLLPTLRTEPGGPPVSSAALKTWAQSELPAGCPAVDATIPGFYLGPSLSPNYYGCCSVTKVVSNSFATLRTVTRQAPLSMEFSKQEYWTGCHFLLQGTFPTQGSHPRLLHRQAGSLPLSRQGRPVFLDTIIYKTKLWVHFLWKSYHKVEGLGQNWVSQLYCAQGSPRSFVKRQLLVLWFRWGPRRCISNKFQVTLMLHVYTVGFRIKLKQKSWQSF